MFQIGCIALCKAAAAYNDKLGVKFANFACVVIGNEIKMQLRRMTQPSRDYRLEAYSLDAEVPDRGIPYAELIPDPVTVEDAIHSLDLMKTIDVLCTEREKRLIDLKLLGKTQREIAAELQCSQPLVSRMLASIQRKIAA